MPVELPSNIPVIYEGHATITICWEFLFGEYPRDKNVSGPGSAIRFGEIWRERLKKRYPKLGVYLTTKSGMIPPLISVSNDYENPRKLIADIAQIGLDIYNNRIEWIVTMGSDDYKRLADLYAPKKTEIVFMAPATSGKQRIMVSPEELSMIEAHIAMGNDDGE